MTERNARSTDPTDYQRLAQPVAAMGKGFADGFEIKPHHHERDQLLYAVSGTMRVRTSGQAWIVPPDRAVYIPGGIVHSLVMRGPVEMRTLYIAPASHRALPTAPRVLAVTDLLRALVVALVDEPLSYAVGSRGDLIAQLILDEIVLAPALALSLPMPGDRRLLRLCEALLDDPSMSATLDSWADQVGASRRTLARLFRAECGATFTAWRQRVRFHAAIEALSRGASVGEAARANGYRSASAFASAFRREFGFPPKAVSGGGWIDPGKTGGGD
ncbi:MAG: AraC family transcriptional regulator [Hyphomicrobiaceae bacterium]